MSHSVDFKGSNKRLGPPQGMTEDQVHTMNVFCNGNVCVSCWTFDTSELEEIMRTGRVFVSVWSGNSQPPIFVGTEDATRFVVADSGPVWKK